MECEYYTFRSGGWCRITKTCDLLFPINCPVGGCLFEMVVRSCTKLRVQPLPPPPPPSLPPQLPSPPFSPPPPLPQEDCPTDATKNERRALCGSNFVFYKADTNCLQQKVIWASSMITPVDDAEDALPVCRARCLADPRCVGLRVRLIRVWGNEGEMVVQHTCQLLAACEGSTPPGAAPGIRLYMAPSYIGHTLGEDHFKLEPPGRTLLHMLQGVPYAVRFVCSAAPKVLCEDLDANCPEWAINKWICSNDDMRANCRASCRTCERGSARGQLRVRLRDAASEALIHEFDWLSIEPVERAYELRYNHTEPSAMDVRLEFDLGSTRQASGYGVVVRMKGAGGRGGEGRK